MLIGSITKKMRNQIDFPSYHGYFKEELSAIVQQNLTTGLSHKPARTDINLLFIT